MNKWAVLVIALLVVAAGWYLAYPLFTTSEAQDAMVSGEVTHNGTWHGADATHQASGTAMVIDGEVLRFENFSVTNGPDLRVYLATDTAAENFIDLGRNRATHGNVNYAIPPGTDFERYDTVLIWCRAFSVLFASAQLQ